MWCFRWIILRTFSKFHRNPTTFFFVFFTSLMCMFQLFVYMLAPVLHRVKDYKLCDRLENGLKLWKPLWEYRHPNASCFTSYCKMNPHNLWSRKIRSSLSSFNILPGRKCWHIWSTPKKGYQVLRKRSTKTFVQRSSSWDLTCTSSRFSWGVVTYFERKIH